MLNVVHQNILLSLVTIDFDRKRCMQKQEEKLFSNKLILVVRFNSHHHHIFKSIHSSLLLCSNQLLSANTNRSNEQQNKQKKERSRKKKQLNSKQQHTLQRTERERSANTAAVKINRRFPKEGSFLLRSLLSYELLLHFSFQLDSQRKRMIFSSSFIRVCGHTTKQRQISLN